MKIDQIMTTLQSVTGQHISMEFKSKGKPSAENKHLQLEKIVKGAFRAGIAFENLTQVKEAIAAGERGEVEELPWGEWKQYPYHITHKGKDYVRFYPSTGGFIQKPSVQYFVNGKETTREEYLSLLPPSARVSKEKECFVVESENILKLGKEE